MGRKKITIEEIKKKHGISIEEHRDKNIYATFNKVYAKKMNMKLFYGINIFCGCFIIAVSLFIKYYN